MHNSINLLIRAYVSIGVSFLVSVNKIVTMFSIIFNQIYFSMKKYSINI